MVLTGGIVVQVPCIMLLARTPFSLALYEVQYRGPQQVTAIELVRRELDPARGFAGTPE